MDSLSFDDLVPQQDAAEPAQPEPSLSFDDLVPPAKESDSLSILGRSLARGTTDAITGVGQSSQFLTQGADSLKPEVRPSDDPELDRLLSQPVAEGWSDPNWWIANTMTPLAGSSPTLAGAIGGAGLGATATRNPYGAAVGGAGGAAAAAVMQTLGPAYVRGLEDGLNADDAFERAWTQAGVSGAFSAVSGALPMFAVAGRTAEGALKAPVKEALFQMFVAQPGVGVAEQAVQTRIEDKDITADDLAKAYIGEAVAGGVLDVGANLATGGYKTETVSDKGGGEAERAALVGGSLPETETVAPKSDIDPAVAQAVAGAPVEAPVAPKRDALLEIARRRDQRAQAPVTPEVTQTPTEVAPEVSQPVASPNAAGTEPPTDVGVGSAAPPVPPAEETLATPNEEITANVPAAPAEEVPPSRANFYADSPETIKLQHAALRDPKNDRKAVVYSADTPIKDLPDKPQGKFIVRRTFKIDGVSTIVDFNTAKTNYGEVQKAIRTGKLNELLDLGPYNQQEVAESAATGAAPVAVTERTPDGTEVKSAAGTEETAPEQVQVLEETKSAPENTIVVEDPRQVIEERQLSQPEVLNAPTQEAPAPKASKAKETSKAREEKAEATPPKRRVLEDKSEESQYVKQLQTEQHEIVADQIKPFLKGRGKEKTLKDADEKTGKNWTPAERAARRKLNEDSEKVVKEYAPTPEVNRAERDFMDEDATARKNARAAIRARAEAMLKAADDADISLPEKVYGNTDKSMDLGAGAMNLVIARDFLDALKSPYKDVEEHYMDFLSRDMRLRRGLLDEVVSERRTEIDDRMRMGQGGNIEQIAATPVGDTAPEADTELSADTKDVADAKIVGKDDVETKVSRSAKMAPKLDDGTQKGELTVKTEDSEGNVKTKKVVVDVAKPASEGRVLSKEEKERVMREMGLLKRESVGGEEFVGSLNDADVLQEVTLADAIAEAGESRGNAVNKSIVNRILARIARNSGDTPVKIVDQKTLDEMFPDRPARAVDGFYDPQKDHIVVSANFLKNGQFDAQLLAHEGLHAYLQRAVESDPALKRDIQEILDFARESAPASLKKAYGFKDVQEFLAEAMSNADFQNLLMSIRLPDALASKYDAPSGAVWQALVSAVRKHLGLGRKDVDALSYTMRLVERAEARRGGEQDLIRGMRQRGLLSQGRQQDGVTPILKWLGRKPVADPQTEALFSGTPEKFRKDAQSWKTAGEAADWLIANSRDEATREIIKKIRPAIENSLFSIVKAGDTVPNIIARNLNSGGMGVYWSKFDTNERALYVRDEFLTEEVVAHELLHAATNTRLKEGNLVKNKGTELAKITAEFYDLQRVVASRYNQLVRGKVNPEVTQSLQVLSSVSSVEELATYGLTNAKVREFFKSIPYRGGNVFTEFVDKIRRLFNIPKQDTNALTKIIELTERLVDAEFSQDTRPYASDFLRDISTVGGSITPAMRDYADELKVAGVPDDIAAELDAFINEEMGKAIDPDTFDLFMEDLKAEYGQDTSGSNAGVSEEEAKEKAKRAKSETEKQAKRMMRNTTKSRDELLDEAYLKALEEFKPGRVPKQNSKALLSLLMNNQLALISDNFFGRNTNPVRRIADLIEMRRTGKQRYVEELGAVAQKLYDLERVYRKKDIKAWENFVSLATDSTVAQTHPDKPLDDEIHKYLGSDKALGGKWSKKQHPRLAAVYNSLPGDLQQLYRETRDALSATRDRVELGNISAVLRKMGHDEEALAKRFFEKKPTEADRKLVGDVVADYIENIVRLSAINGPYFNLARQGDIVLTGRYKVTTPSNGTKIKDGVFEFKSRGEAVKFYEEQTLRPTISRVAIDPKTGERFFIDDDGTQVKATFADPSAEERYRVTVQTKYVEFFHSVAAAKEKAEALKDMVELNDVEPKRFERSAANADMLSDQMRALASTLDTRLKGANLTPEQQAVLKGTLNEASLRFMASTRLQTHRLPRRYVQGFSKDLVVSTYQYVDSSAGYLAKLDTQVELEDAMRQMEKAVNALSSRREGIGGGARAISNEVERRVNDIDYNMDQGLVAGVANRTMAVNFINHLMSPMYTVLQVVQTPLVAGPVLAGEYGVVRSSYHLTKASKDIGALQIGLKGVVATAKGVAGINTPGRTYTDYARARLTAEEQRAVDKLIKLGAVDADAGFDVTRLERKDNKIARGIDATLEYFSNIARAAPQSIEAINRSVVGLATFRMARKDGLSFDEAVRKAQEAVELTHFNLSASNAAPIFRHPVGRLLLQFKKYGQNIYFLHYYNAARVLRPKVKGDRAKGAKTLLYLAATHQIAAGLVGLPIEPLKIAVLALGMIPGMPEWEDLERLAEEALAEMMGEDGAEAMMYGLPRLANIDISSRVGLSSLLLFGEPGEMGDKNSVQAWFLNMLLGPTVGTATDIAVGIGAAAEGDLFKATEKLLPPKVISDSLRAVRETDEGTFDTQDALMRAFGVQSARQARIQRDTSADIDKRSELKREKNAIIKAWLSADTAGERSKIVARMREYNKEAGKRDRLSIKFLNNIKRREERKYKAE